MRRVGAALACAIALVLCACTATNSTFEITQDDDGVHVVATGTASGAGDGSIEIDEDEGLCINHIVNKGSFHVTATNEQGTVVFDEDLTDNIADFVDVQGEIELIISSTDADGTIDVIAYDKEAQAQAEATLPDAISRETGMSAEELGLTTQTEGEPKVVDD